MVNSGAQTLLRGLYIIETVKQGNNTLKKISAALSLSKSTAHRLASVLVQERFLRFNGSEYILGSRLIEYGMHSLSGYPLRTAALPLLKELSLQTKETIHLGIREDNEVFYIEKIAGSRAINMNSRIGFRMPLVKTGIGKALLLDTEKEELSEIYMQINGDFKGLSAFLEKMADYRSKGYTLDLEENEAGIRCVAAPVRDAENQLIAAISVASITPYMDDARMQELTVIVTEYAERISQEFGWSAP